MAEKTGIEWCDATFNQWWGCQKVSPACDNCYAERDAKRFVPGKVLWGVGSERRTFDVTTKAGEKHWRAPLTWAKRLFYECSACGWRGTDRQAVNAQFGKDFVVLSCPRCEASVTDHVLKLARQRVFCASMADWLDMDAPIADFVRLLDTIRRTPGLDWLQLSKRIGNLTKRLSEAEGFVMGAIDAQAERAGGLQTGAVGGADDRRAGAYLAGREAFRRSMDGRHEDDAMRSGARGAGDTRGLPAGASVDRRQAALRSGSATGVAALQRAGTAGPDGQPQERQEARQPAGEPGTGDVQRAAAACGEGAGRQGMGPPRLEASEDRLDRGASDRDAASARGGRDGQVARGAVRHQPERGIADLPREHLEALLAWVAAWLAGTPPANVWIGSTVVNQAEADRDIPKLLAVPARVRFLSIEPILSAIDVTPWLHCFRKLNCDYCAGRRLHWIIAGGESGPKARPSHPDWFRSLRDQCAAAGVPFHFKQWGEWVPYEESAQPPFYHSQHGHEIDGHALPDFESDDGRQQREWHCDYVEQILARRVGKAAAGRLLDGVEHNGFPA